jgi:hypothetical protein
VLVTVTLLMSEPQSCNVYRNQGKTTDNDPDQDSAGYRPDTMGIDGVIDKRHARELSPPAAKVSP